MTWMALMPIMGKNVWKSSLEPKSQLSWVLVCRIGDVGPNKFAQMMLVLSEFNVGIF